MGRLSSAVPEPAWPFHLVLGQTALRPDQGHLLAELVVAVVMFGTQDLLVGWTRYDTLYAALHGMPRVYRELRS